MARRFMLLAALVITGSMMLTGCAPATAEKDASSITFSNEESYAKDGTFSEEKGKDAVIALMEYHGYPVFEGIRDQIWVSDYGKGKFTEFGLAAVMFMNNEEHRYMLMDIYLMPSQMLPEHWHLKSEANPAKLEGWLVRHGLSHIVGEGEPNLHRDVVVPACHNDGKVTTMHAVVAKPGMFVPLNRATARHWQYAGPEGAIITEVANVHTNSAVRHTDKEANDFFLKPAAE